MMIGLVSWSFIIKKDLFFEELHFYIKITPLKVNFFSMNNHYDLCDRYENQADESRKILGEVETHKNRVEAKCQ